jgi:predicted nucleotidyltransferase
LAYIGGMVRAALTTEDTIRRLRLLEPDLRARGLTALYLFGSMARDQVKPDSDIDLLCEFAPDAKVGAFGFLDIRRALENLLARKVDLVEPEGLHRLIRDEVLHRARPVFS